MQIELKELQMEGRYDTPKELQDAVDNKLYPPALVYRGDYKEEMQPNQTQVEIQCTDGEDCMETIAEYPLTVRGTSDIVTGKHMHVC